MTMPRRRRKESETSFIRRILRFTRRHHFEIALEWAREAEAFDKLPAPQRRAVVDAVAEALGLGLVGRGVR